MRNHRMKDRSQLFREGTSGAVSRFSVTYQNNRLNRSYDSWPEILPPAFAQGITLNCVECCNHATTALRARSRNLRSERGPQSAEAQATSPKTISHARAEILFR